MKLRNLVLAASIAMLPVSAAMAQTTTYKQRHTINARSNRQQARINHGVADGQITPKGAARADANQSRIRSEDQSMRAADNGHLTAQDRHKLARQQNRTSQGIYNRNHNQVTDPGVAPH